MALKWKVVDGKIEMNDRGLPVVFDDEDDEKEPFGLDGIHLYSKVPELKNTTDQLKKNMDAYKKKLGIFKDYNIPVDDEDEDFTSIKKWLDSAKEAKKTVDNFGQGKLKTAEEVENVKKQAKEEMQEMLTDQKKKFEQMVGEFKEKYEREKKYNDKLMISDRFKDSKFVKEKLAMTPKMAEKYFGDKIRVEVNDTGERTIVGYFDSNFKEKILSPEKGFDTADFDEIIQKLVEKDSDRDSLIISSAGGSGSGAGSPVGTKQNNPWLPDSFNLTKQGEIMRKNPELAMRLKAEARGK